jgi:predicted transcriptional regulator
MTRDEQLGREVDRFILEHIDSVPHLEALLLLWNSRPKPWTAQDLGQRLFVEHDVAQRILTDLLQRGLIASKSDSARQYCCESLSEAHDRLIAAVDSTYRREMVRISKMIHS